MYNSTSLIPPFFFNLITNTKSISNHTKTPGEPIKKKYLRATIVFLFIAAGIWLVYPVAMDLANQTFQNNPGNQNAFSTYTKEGDRYFGEKKYYEALQKYNAALAINNNSVSVWEKKGDIYRILSENDISKLSSALSSYEIAKNLDPGNSQILEKIGDLYADNRDYINAFRYYNDAISINPDFKNEMTTLIGYLFNEAAFYKSQKEFDTALTIYNGILTYKYLDSHSEQIALSEKITCLYELGRNREAVETNIILERKYNPNQFASS